jgi:long-subunit fatty acid transport protein
MMRLRATLSVLGLLLLAAPLHAQSLFATRGLGAPLLSADARGQALGGMTTGLLGFTSSVNNIADAMGVGRRGLAAAIQPSRRAVSLGDETDHITATRFPILHVFYPIRSKLVGTLGYGGFLDQGWALATDGTEHVRGDTVGTHDELQSIGGIAQLKAGVAYAVTPSLSVGLGAGLYTGGDSRVVSRIFPDSVNNLMRGFTTRTEWTFRAPLVTGGARLDLGSAARVAASVTYGGMLKAHGLDSIATDRRFHMPLQASFGASGQLASRLLVAVSADYSGWNRAANDFQGGVFGEFDASQTTARDTWSYGGGIEYSIVQGGDKPSLPIRIGARKTQYPFYLTSDQPVNETTYSLGFGRRFLGDETSPLAVGDLAVEYGKRTGGPGATTAALSESFVRLTVSLALFGR